MHRLTELVHHVVGHVDHRADRPHPGRHQAPLHPVRRRSIGDLGEPARREPRAEIPVLDRHADVGARLLIGLGKADRWLAQGRAAEGGHLARQADHGERVAPVGLDVDVEHHLAVDRAQVGAQRLLLVAAQDEDAVCIPADVELARRAEHAVADHAADLRPLDAPVPG